jgi:hypothetical protein
LDAALLPVVLLAVAALVASVVPRIVLAPGRKLRRQFAALGSPPGRTRRETVKAAGEPAPETALPDGRTLLQWRTTGYHIALVFEKNGRCFGVTHENGRRIRGSGQAG